MGNNIPFTCTSVYCDTINVTGNGTMPCQADFVAYHDTIISPTNSPYLYHFYDLSMGTPTNWLWDFGDGATSTNQTPMKFVCQFGIIIFVKVLIAIAL